jgi:hypothetical protein
VRVALPPEGTRTRLASVVIGADAIGLNPESGDAESMGAKVIDSGDDGAEGIGGGWLC